jgi:hypothetical protein
MVSAAIYCRFSSDDQGQELYTSIDAQREVLTEYAAREDYVIVAEFTDEAKTGTNLKRAGYRDLLAAARAKRFDVVLVTFMDRLARGSAYTIAEHELSLAGCRVVTAKQNFGPGVSGYIGQSARQMVDGIYPKLVAEWTIAKMERMLAAGFHVCGRAPYGYKAVEVDPDEIPTVYRNAERKRPPKRLVIDLEAAPYVIEAYRLMASGEGRQADVQRFLSAATGDAWSFERVRRLLTSRNYRGETRWGVGPGRLNPAAHPPLIDEETWQSVQTRLYSARTEEGKRERVIQEGDPAYYLRGRIYCACGRRMTVYWVTGRNRKRYMYYQCLSYNSRTPDSDRCQSPGRAFQVSAEQLHRAVFSYAFGLAKAPWRLRTILEEARRRVPAVSGDVIEAATGDARKLAREAQRLAREKEQIVTAIGVAPAAALIALTQRLAVVEEDLKKAQRMEAEARDTADKGRGSRFSGRIPTTDECRALLSRMAELWAAATEEERSEIAGLILESVTMEGHGKVTARYRLPEIKSPAVQSFGTSGAEMRSPHGRFRVQASVQGPVPGAPLNTPASNSPSQPPEPPFTLALPLVLHRWKGGGD